MQKFHGPCVQIFLGLIFKVHYHIPRTIPTPPLMCAPGCLGWTYFLLSYCKCFQFKISHVCWFLIEYYAYICKIPCEEPLINVYINCFFSFRIVTTCGYIIYIHSICILYSQIVVYKDFFIVMYYCRDVIDITEFLP